MHPRPIYIEKQTDDAVVECAIQYNAGFSEGTFSFANCINTIDGGSHLTGFRSALTRVLNDQARKQKLLKDGDPNLTGEDVREGLVAVVFNGCIYNHRELRRKLKAAGHTFVTDHSDTEVLIAGHRQWGERLQEHLEGMYAYAIWDRKAASLTLARDWFGEKPLYHHVQADDEGVKLLIASSDAQAAAPPHPSPPPAGEGLDAPQLRVVLRDALSGARDLDKSAETAEEDAEDVPEGTQPDLPRQSEPVALGAPSGPVAAAGRDSRARSAS